MPSEETTGSATVHPNRFVIFFGTGGPGGRESQVDPLAGHQNRQDIGHPPSQRLGLHRAGGIAPVYPRAKHLSDLRRRLDTAQLGEALQQVRLLTDRRPARRSWLQWRRR